MALLGALAPTLVAACGPDASGGGWRPVTLDSLQGTVNYEYRTGDRGDGLSAQGDFDGDGEADRAVLVSDEAAGKYAVRVEFSSGEEHIVAEANLADLPLVGLSTVPAGVYQTACGKGLGACPDDAAQVIDLAHDGFTLAAFESASRTFWWEDGAIHSEWTSD
jgi:hypothetical protein